MTITICGSIAALSRADGVGARRNSSTIPPRRAVATWRGWGRTASGATGTGRLLIPGQNNHSCDHVTWRRYAAALWMGLGPHCCPLEAPDSGGATHLCAFHPWPTRYSLPPSGEKPKRSVELLPAPRRQIMISSLRDSPHRSLFPSPSAANALPAY